MYFITTYTSWLTPIRISIIPKSTVYVTALTPRSYVPLFTIINIVIFRADTIIVIIFTWNNSIWLITIPPITWFKYNCIHKASLSGTRTQLANLLRIIYIWFLNWILIFWALITYEHFCLRIFNIYFTSFTLSKKYFKFYSLITF